MTVTDVQHASDRLFDDARLVENAGRRIMDSITGEWGCEGRPFLPEMCSAVASIVDAVGRFGHAIEKAALDIYARAEDGYIDRFGDRADATDEIRDIAQGLLQVAKQLRDFPEDAYPVTRRLGSIGERE